MLVANGGRPTHPLSLMKDIVKNPGECQEILLFWQDSTNGPDDWEVFGPQLARWQDFRRLQNFARGQNTYDYWRCVWEEERTTRIWTGFEDETESGEDDWQEFWEYHKKDHDDLEEIIFVSMQYRDWSHFIGHEGSKTKEGRFPEYVKALKDRLAKHGFTRIFQLDQDPAQQDKLTTWIEYLGYEYWWYDLYHDAITKNVVERYNNSWKKLVDSNLLRPFETEEYICRPIFGQETMECQRAETAVESVSLAVESIRKSIADQRNSKSSFRDLQQRLLRAQSKLDMELKEQETMKGRHALINEFIQETAFYRSKKREAEHYLILVRWVLQQIPLIELELVPLNMPEKDLDGVDRRGAKHGQVNKLELDKQQDLQDQGRKHDERMAEDTVSASQVTKHKRRSRDVIDDERFSRSRYNNQGPDHSDNKISKPRDTKVSTGAPMHSEVVKTTSVKKEKRLAGNKKARLVKKGRKEVKTKHASGLDTSVRRSGKASSNTSKVTKPFRRSAPRIAEREQRGPDTSLRRRKKASPNIRQPRPSITKTLRRSARIAEREQRLLGPIL